jgi:hypothetical protein
MHRSTTRLAALVVSLLALSVTACNKRPAQEALAEADRALAAARPDLEKYLPDELAELTAAAGDARAKLEEGQYTEALRAAQDLPLKIQLALGAAAVARNEMTARWKEISATVPDLVRAVGAKVAEIEATKRLPQGVDEAAFAAARTDLESVTQAWSQATAAVQAKAEALARLLGLARARAPAAPGR